MALVNRNSLFHPRTPTRERLKGGKLNERLTLHQVVRDAIDRYPA